MQLKKNIPKGVIFTVIQQAFVQGVNFLIYIILGKHVPPSSFALVGMMMVFIMLGNVIIDGGLGISIIRSNVISKKDLYTIFWYNAIIGLFVYFILYACAPYISGFYQQSVLVELIRLYCIVLLISSFGVVPQSILIREMKYMELMIISIISTTVSCFIAIVLILKGYGIWSLIWYYLFNSFLTTSLSWIYTRFIPKPCFSKSIFLKHFSFGFSILTTGVIEVFFNQIYNIILGKVYQPSVLGNYLQADKFKQAPAGALSNVIDRITLPLFSKHQEDIDYIKNKFIEITTNVVVVVFPFYIYSIAFADVIFDVLLSKSWNDAAKYYKIIAIAGMLYPLHVCALSIIKVKGNGRAVFRLEIIKKIIIIFSLVFSFFYGILGLLWGQVFASIVCLFLNYYVNGKLINASLFWQIKQLWKVFGVNFILYLFCVLFIAINSLWITNWFINLLLTVSVSLVVYFCLLCIIKPNLKNFFNFKND